MLSTRERWSHLSIFEAALYVHAWVAIHEKEDEGFRRELRSSTKGALLAASPEGVDSLNTPCTCAHLKAACVLAAGLVLASEQVVLLVAFIIQTAKERRHASASLLLGKKGQPGIVNGDGWGVSYVCSAYMGPPRVSSASPRGGDEIRIHANQSEHSHRKPDTALRNPPGRSAPTAAAVPKSCAPQPQRLPVCGL